MAAAALPTKRLILCCDGTWMDSYDGYKKPTLIPYYPYGTLQIPSNVTRISRALTKIGRDGKPQIIYYHSGVGTGSSIIDTVAGGLLGIGISENIREAYSFIASNYVPGDEIILIGFSRGAFTVRSVAGMINDIGLLTRSGMAEFYPIFKDCENFKNEHYHDIFPTIPFSNKPRGANAGVDYKRMLLEHDLTRVVDDDGRPIGVQAVAVWDTVGSLGIPNIPVLAKVGLQSSAKEYKFYDTNLSGIVRHAFQVLALDENRASFSPAVWERTNMQKTTIDLRQVWFPGAHSNIGGGYDDQGMANITLAWMMDQLASIGVAFQDETIDQIYAENMRYYQNPPVSRSLSGVFSRKDTQWARKDIYEKHKPIRPWGLSEIYDSDKGIWRLAGRKCRTPGLNVRADPESDTPTTIPLRHTNERVHSSVRIRLQLEGLDADDKGVYKCHALLEQGPWRLRQVRMRDNDPIPYYATWGGVPPSTVPDETRWVWEYDGPEEGAPVDRVMIEENLGPYEKKLLLLNAAGDKTDHRHHKRRRRRSRRRDSQYVDRDDDLVISYGGDRHHSRTPHKQVPEATNYDEKFSSPSPENDPRLGGQRSGSLHSRRHEANEEQNGWATDRVKRSQEPRRPESWARRDDQTYMTDGRQTRT